MTARKPPKCARCRKHPVRSRTLCVKCYMMLRKIPGGLDDYPRKTYANGELLAEMLHLGFNPDKPLRPQYRAMATQLGTSPTALEMAYRRYREREAA